MKQEDRKAIEEHRMICVKYRTIITESDANKYCCVEDSCPQLFVLAMIPQSYIVIPIGLEEVCENGK